MEAAAPYSVPIIADGGIRENTVPKLVASGAQTVVLGSLASNPGNALRGGGLLLLGIPVFLYWRQRAVAQ